MFFSSSKYRIIALFQMHSQEEKKRFDSLDYSIHMKLHLKKQKQL